MSINYLKKASKTSATDESDVREAVQTMLDELRVNGEAKVREFAAKGWTGWNCHTGRILIAEISSTDSNSKHASDQKSAAKLTTC